MMYDTLPAFRPDVVVLFGKDLPLLGVCSDLLGQASMARSREQGLAWPAGRLWIQGAERKGLIGELIRPLQDLYGMRRLSSEHGVIQVRDKIRTGLLALAVARLTGRKFSYWMSFPFAEGYRLRAEQVGRSKGRVVQLANWARATLAGPAYYRFLAQRCDHLFVQSEAMLEFMVGKGVRRESMTAVPMGVDLALFDVQVPMTARPARLAGRKVLAYLGALGRSRSSDFLLRVFERVRQVEPEALLLLIGEGASEDEARWVREQIEASGLAEHVWLTGWMAQPEAIALLRHADLAWSAIPRGALFDVSSPTKAVEYLALGLPCVGNDIPDQKLVLERSGGGLCVPMELEAFADASLRVLRDPDLAQALRRKGPPWVAAHRSYRVLAEGVAAVYHRLVASQPGSAASP
ncbi:glycosyltransferase [Paucibacter sp. B51]|uniref:glycosyltransferase n=1 Tax=Paucibacter sp. B51 TaxID=2993315 RepID=UPI0022EBBB60|nr:glycosyltransferase [Paucibacter sp. B51]